MNFQRSEIAAIEEEAGLKLFIVYWGFLHYKDVEACKSVLGDCAFCVEVDQELTTATFESIVWLKAWSSCWMASSGLPKCLSASAAYSLAMVWWLILHLGICKRMWIW